MKMQKLTPKDKKEIAVRVAAGERQVDLVKEYDVSKGLISRVVKESKIVKTVDLSDKTPDQLCNRYRQVYMELIGHNDELEQRFLEAKGLQRSIEVESKKDAGVRDEGWILSQKKRLTWCEDTTRIAYGMARLYQEGSAILQTLGKRGVPVPVVGVKKYLSS